MKWAVRIGLNVGKMVVQRGSEGGLYIWSWIFVKILARLLSCSLLN